MSHPLRLVALTILAAACSTATQLGTHLTITDTVPAGGTKGIPTTTSFVVVFSESLDEATVTADTVQLLDDGGNPVSGLVDYDDGAASIAFVPDEPLQDYATYTLVIDDDIQSLKHGGLGGIARMTYETEAAEGDADTDTDTDTDSDTDSDTDTDSFFEPTRLAVYYEGGVYGAEPTDVIVDATTTVAPELVLALLEVDDAALARNPIQACHLVFDISEGIAIANFAGTFWSLAWGVDLARAPMEMKGRCSDLDPAVWDPKEMAKLLGLEDVTFTFEPLDDEIATELATSFGDDWNAVEPFILSTNINLGKGAVPAGYSFSYGMEPDHEVVRDGEGNLVPQSLEGATAAPNGYYPTEAIRTYAF